MKFKRILSIFIIIIMLGFSFFFVRELLKPEILPVGSHLETLILKTENGTERYILKKDKPTVVFVLSETCGHCIYQIESLGNNINRYSNYDLLFLIRNASIQSDTLSELSSLSRYSNVTVQMVKGETIQEIFGKGGVPRFFLIDQNGYLRKKISGEVKPDYLLNEIESLFVRAQR